jgi:hypothetical protein
MDWEGKSRRNWSKDWRYLRAMMKLMIHSKQFSWQLGPDRSNGQVALPPDIALHKCLFAFLSKSKPPDCSRYKLSSRACQNIHVPDLCNYGYDASSTPLANFSQMSKIANLRNEQAKNEGKQQKKLIVHTFSSPLLFFPRWIGWRKAKGEEEKFERM